MKHGTVGEERESYHQKLKKLIDDYAHLAYSVTKSFPKEETYGLTSQLRRSALSVILNYVEGCARERNRVHENFLEISFGSLKESQYLMEFSHGERYITDDDHSRAVMLGNEIGAMLWGTIRSLKEKH